jgi:hypothetical protein
MSEADKTKLQINEYSKEIDSIKYKAIKAKVLKSEIEI